MTSETNLRRTFILFHLTLAVVVFIESVMTVVHSIHEPGEGHRAMILPWFAGVEALAAIMLVIPKTLRLGGAILLAIFVLAIIAHGPLDQMPLFVFAAAVIFIMIHGSAFSWTSESKLNDTKPEEITR